MLVALVAASVPPFWFWLVLGSVSIVAVPVMLASGALWFAVATQLERIPSAPTRLLVAAVCGLMSPELGAVLTALAGTCTGCCMVPIAIPGVYALMWERPLWFFPFGVGMGFVAFALTRPVGAPEVAHREP